MRVLNIVVESQESNSGDRWRGEYDNFEGIVKIGDEIVLKEFGYSKENAEVKVFEKFIGKLKELLS